MTDETSTIESTESESAGAEADAFVAEAAPVTSVDAAKIEALEAEVKENYDKYLRAIAEFENFKKRALRERSDILKYAGENIARDLLEVLDNFTLAFNQEGNGPHEEFVKGIKMIHDRFNAILEQHQVRGESALGGIFDPVKQQALASVPTADQPVGTILEEFKKAYFFKDKLLRPGQVVVATAVAPETEEKASE